MSLLRAARIRVRGVLYHSVLNDREYELVDHETGRQHTIMSIGAVPRQMDRDAPLLSSLFFDGARSAVFPLKSAALQVMGMTYQVNWPIFFALAQLDPGWTPQARLCEPITEEGKVNIAVVRHDALTLGGDGTEHLLRALGCNVVEMPLDGTVSQNVPIHGVYIPHGPSYMVLHKFFSNIYLKTMLARAYNGNYFLFAEGASAPILGDKIDLPSGTAGGGSGRGFGILPFNARFQSGTAGSPQKRVAIRRMLNPMLSGSQEWAWGYTSRNMTIIPHSPGDECWKIGDTLDSPTGFDGWCEKRILATSMRLEPWSAPESFRRWLEG
jgi:cobyrinic acid a,c-diamide synthase